VLYFRPVDKIHSLVQS